MKWSHVGEFFIGLLAALAVDAVILSLTAATEARPMGGDPVTPIIVAHIVMPLAALAIKRPAMAAGTVVVVIVAPLLAAAACGSIFGQFM